MRMITSPFDFCTTVDRLLRAIEAADMIIFARIDHAELARSAGFAMMETLVIIYGNPKGGTPVMLAAPAAALDLPLRVLVRNDGNGCVQIFYHPAETMLSALGARSEVAAYLVPAQSLLEKALLP